ncbi:MAG: tetratricopeptide repeat protein [Flavobacteriales bacterium]|nr:tetratricopeptide repeat protein [Flavobacteriales bacterium]
MIRTVTLRFLVRWTGACLLCGLSLAAARAQEDPISELSALVQELKTDTAQFRLVTAPTELWPIEREARTPYRQAMAGLARAVVLSSRPDINSAVIVLDHVVNLLDSGPHERALALAYYYLGRAELIRNNMAGSIVQYERALHLTARVPYPKLEAMLQSDIGSAYASIEDFAQASTHYKAAIALPLDTINRYWTLGSLMEAMLELGDTSAASHYLKRMEVLVDSAGMNPALAVLERGELYLAQGDPGKAINQFNQALDLYRASGQLTFIAWTLSRLSNAYRAAGQTAKAVQLAREGLQLSMRNNLRKEIQDNEEQLYQAYAAAGDKPAAYDHFVRFIALRDSATGTKASALLTASMLRNQMERQARTDSLLRAEKDLRRAEQHQAELDEERTQRNIFLLASIALLAFGASTLRQRNKIRKARDRSDELLLNILPEEVAEELKEKGESMARSIDQVTVLFTDFKGFTGMSEKMGAQELVNEIDTCFRAFDRILAKRGVEKIKTIGDAYMAAGGMPIPSADSARSTVLAALEMQDFMRTYKAEREAAGRPFFEMRIGIHTGPVVAGIVGVKKFQYDIWGDTVNTASRMESSGEVGRVNISEATYRAVVGSQLSVVGQGAGSRATDNQQLTTPAFAFTPRGKVQAKGKGEMEMYFVERNEHAA